MGGFWEKSRGRGSIVGRLGVASLLTVAGTLGTLGALAAVGAPPAGASGITYYAYPDGGATTPLVCPQTTTAADQCTLTQALSIVGAGDTVALAVSGDESDPSTWYVGNFSVSGGGSDLSSPLTIEPAAGVFEPILDGNHGGATGCSTGSCNSAVLTVPSSSFVDLNGVTIQNANSVSTTSGGGGISNQGTLNIDASTFEDDQSIEGGAIDNGYSGSGTLIVSSSTFRDNQSPDGGAIDNASYGVGTLVVSSSDFSGNIAQELGGAIDNGLYGNGTASVTTSTFSGNVAIDGSGGAIVNGFSGHGSMSITDSTFRHNEAGTYVGGAIDTGDDGTGGLSVGDSTFVDNQAPQTGGAIQNGAEGGSGALTVTQSTFLANGAPAGAALDGTATLAADVLAQNTSGGNCPGAEIDGGYNVSDDDSCDFSATGSVNGSGALDSYLGPLGANGGPTETVPLDASPVVPVGPDPALDAVPGTFDLPDGTAACSVPDQRGVTRTGPCDMGAFEAHPANLATETTLVGSASSTLAGTSVTYTATVIPTTDDEAGSAVTFTEDGSPAVCTGSTFDGQTATCTIAYPVPGVHEIRATYGGDTVFAASAPSAPWTTTVTSVAPPSPVATTTTLSSSATGVAPGQSLTLTATVAPTQGGPSPGSVTFDDDGQPLDCGPGSGAFNGSTATCVTSFSELPQHQVTAVYSGDASATGSTSSPLLITVAFANPGYRLAAADGGVFAFGAPFDGSMGGHPLNAPIVGTATDSATGGYWLVAADGGVFSFDAPFYGSMGGQPLDAPIVGMAATANGDGYWLVASDGGIFAFGKAAFAGSMGGQHLNAPVVGMAPDSATGGYWEVASDGGIFSFDAPFEGSAGSLHLAAPIAAMAATADGGGYWLAGSDGGVFNYGDATFHGSNADTGLASPIVGIATDIYTGGYWLVAGNGAIEAYDAPGDGMFPDLAGSSRAVSIASG